MSREKTMIRIQTEEFDAGAEIARLRQGDRRIGAVASFVGIVRDMNDESAVSGMLLEHYPGMAEKALDAILEKAKARWAIMDALVVHRVGELKPADTIVLVAVAAAHRREAFAACEFIVDYLKTEAPFWKKESTPEGERWVEARASDTMALSKWKQGEG